jgi:transcriptional regulator with XRE-family HTH domain
MEKHLTQRQLAEQLGITTRYLKAIENSGRKPSFGLLTRIFCELEISADNVFHPDSAAKQYKFNSSND